MFVIVGHGFVGRGTSYLLDVCGNIENVYIHDPDQGSVVEDWSVAKYAFLCVPTPEKNGALDLSILKETYEMVVEKGLTPIIRSTIGPDQVPLFPKAIMMPEFLREQSWAKDVEEIEFVILGGDVPEELRTVFMGKTVFLTDPVSAMMFKLARNAALAVKVTMANEFYNVCNKYNVNYDDLSALFKMEGCIGITHWDVPGPDGMFGFGGKCFPKDLTHFDSLCEDENLFKTALNSNLLFRNKSLGD
jgi:UDP-glucose 6-dehydrogenase